jgi:hypothetical protein
LPAGAARWQAGCVLIEHRGAVPEIAADLDARVADDHDGQ